MSIADDTIDRTVESWAEDMLAAIGEELGPMNAHEVSAIQGLHMVRLLALLCDKMDRVIERLGMIEGNTYK